MLPSRGHSLRFFVSASLAVFLTTALLGATPTIIPLPEQVQSRPGVFTLCPSQASYAAPGHPLVKIFTDPVSQPTGQFLAAQLFKSTGWRFLVATTTNGLTGRSAILRTTANANTKLGAEGYELTVAPDSVVIRAPATAGFFYGV